MEKTTSPHGATFCVGVPEEALPTHRLTLPGTLMAFPLVSGSISSHFLFISPYALHYIFCSTTLLLLSSAAFLTSITNVRGTRRDFVVVVPRPSRHGVH